MSTVNMFFRTMLLTLIALSLPTLAQPDESVRALRHVLQGEKTSLTQLEANTGWQPLYVRTVEVKQGDLLRLVGVAQLTLDAVPMIGQQMRLTVNGHVVGGQFAEINTQPGTHHLPMTLTALYPAPLDGKVVVALEGSAFHSDGNFPLVIDHQGELATGSLFVEVYRSYPDLESAWNDQALLLNDVHRPAIQAGLIWGQAPYLQQAVSSLKLPVNSGDVLRPSAQAVASPSFGLEQFTGVLSSQEQPISAYGGQNVISPENPMAPMWLEGYSKVKEDGHLLLEHRLYGAFGNGLTLVPETARFEIAHYASYGRALQEFYQSPLAAEQFVANGSSFEVWHREVSLKPDDLLRVTASLQLGPQAQPVPVDMRLIVEVFDPTGVLLEQSMSGKSLSPVKTMVPLASFLTARADVEGPYRVSVKLNGISPAGPLPVLLSGSQSQVQLLHFALPAGGENSAPSDESP